MDDEEIEDKFIGMAMNEYAASIHKFIEDTRIMEMKIRIAMADDDHATATMLSANMFHAISSVQVGTIHNLITSYAHALNDERTAGLEVFGIGEDVLDDLRAFHAHLVRIGQPTEELLMVTDLMTKLDTGLKESMYGRIPVDVGEE